MNVAVPDKLLQVHAALAEHGVPHAFGGAIALASYGEPRATQDIDVNIALPPAAHRRVLDSLATLFSIENRERAAQEIVQIAQTRLRWEATPIDLRRWLAEFYQPPDDAPRRRVERFLRRYHVGGGSERR